MWYLGSWMSSTSSDITWWWKRISPTPTGETSDHFWYNKIQSPWPRKDGLFSRTILRGRYDHSVVGPQPATHSCTSITMFKVNNSTQQDCCVLQIKPFFLPVDIQHTQCPCRFFLLERHKLCCHIRVPLLRVPKKICCASRCRSIFPFFYTRFSIFWWSDEFSKMMLVIWRPRTLFRRFAHRKHSQKSVCAYLFLLTRISVGKVVISEGLPLCA